MLIGCIAWFSVGMGLVAIAPTPELFGLFRFVAGLGLGGVLPVATALTTEYSPPRYRNIIYAFMFTGFPIGGILAAFLGIFLIPAFGFRIMFFLGLLPLVLIVPFAVMRLPESIAFLLANGRRSEAEAIASRYNISLESDQVRSAETAEESAAPSRFSSLFNLFSRNYVVATLLFWITSFLGLFMIYGLNTWLPTIMRDSGYSLGSALSFLLMLNVGGIIGTLLIGVAADRVGSKPTTVFTFLLAAVSIALLSIEFPLVGVYLLAGLGGIGVLATQTFINAYVSKHYPPKMGATALGWSLGMGRLGSIAAPLALGALFSLQLDTQWYFFAIAIPGLFGAALIFSVPRSPTEAEKAPRATGKVASPE